MGGTEVAYWVLVEKPRGRRPRGRLAVDGTLIAKWIYDGTGGT